MGENRNPIVAKVLQKFELNFDAQRRKPQGIFFSKQIICSSQPLEPDTRTFLTAGLYLPRLTMRS